MKRSLPVLALILLATAVPARAAIPFIEDDVDTAFREAREKNKPLLVYFHTIWCSYCVELEDKVFTDDDVSDKSNYFVPLRLNCDRRGGQRLTGRYHVTSYPTVLVLKPSGEILGRLGMYKPPKEFLEWMNDSLSPTEALPALDARIEKGERSAQILLRSADRHFDARETDVAEQRYRQALAADPDGKAGVADDAEIGLAATRNAAGDSAAALEHFLTVLRSYPDSNRLSEAFTGAVSILRDENRGAEIDKLFDDFGPKFPNDPAVLIDHALRLLDSGREPALALAKSKRAVDLSPDAAGYHATYARALAAVGRSNEALTEIDGAIKMRPADKQLRLWRLEILEKVKTPQRPQTPVKSGEAASPGR